MADEKRPYRMKRRAESEEKTRLHITESTIALHATLGPSRTSISAIAKHAGVRRSTVYRHFPDETALFAACTSHWMAANRLPDLASWGAVSDADERLQTALQELYAYYRRTEPMMANIHRDEESMPIVRQMMHAYRRYLADARETLMAGRPLNPSTRRRVRAAIGLALAFPVWRSLAFEQALKDADCTELMCMWVATARANPTRKGESR
jgi:AcrR family transcriptional regulator